MNPKDIADFNPKDIMLHGIMIITIHINNFMKYHRKIDQAVRRRVWVTRTWVPIS
jgi:hypothetical protein